MKKLIYITGQIDNPFFLNEIDEFVNNFDEVEVFAYAESSSRCEKISKRYGFKYCIIKKSDILKHPFKFLKWIKLPHVRYEMRENCRGNNKVKKLVYAFLYGMFAVELMEKIDSKDELSKEIYIYSFWLSRGAYAAAYIKDKIKSMRAVSRAHGYDLYEERNDLRYLPFRKFISENLDSIAFISKDGKQYFESLCNKRKYSYCDLEVCHLGTFGAPINKSFKPCAGKIVIASCSSIIQIKRLDLIINVVSALKKKYQNVEWIHIGDGNLREEIEKKAHEELKTGYKFYGLVNNENILNIYQSENVNFFINMSDSEGIPVSIMEAISVGIPTVARNVGGISEIVFNSFDGMLVPENGEALDTGKIADFIIETNKSQKTYSLYSENAVILWKKQYNANINISKFINIIKNIEE